MLNRNYNECTLDKIKDWLSFITDPIKKDLINVFRLEDEESSQDIEVSIVEAFIKGINYVLELFF